MRLLRQSVVRVACVIAGLAISSWAAPFAQKVQFAQPDGTRIELWGEGDDFHAVFESLDGYTVTFDPASKTYFYATVSDDGNTLVATDLAVGKGDPALRGLTPHARISAEATRKQARERFEKWDSVMGVTRRWNERKAQTRVDAQVVSPDAPVKAPPAGPTTDQKMGLTLLIDFDNDPATIPHAEIIDFCNADNYTGFGNNGSVKKYFQDNSNGLLTYSNTVTAYIRIPNSVHPKSWYNDTTKDCGAQANYLIRDALDILKALPNYETEILPQFDSLTVDAGNSVIACNVFYAGDNGGVWTYGLWPHSWGLYVVGEQELSPGGKKVFRYQVTNIGDTLTLGTFCHENGHMLCDFPDIYDYDYDSVGGAGMFCLMDYGGSGGNPVQVCAYLKYKAGWAPNTIDLNAKTSVWATVVSTPYQEGFNQFYRFQKPGTNTEYYLFENRQRTGRDANIPGAGIAIWHVDELGDRDNQSLAYNTRHANYECTLVQADNLWHFQRYINGGDGNDLFYLGNTAVAYSGLFNDNTAPSARWWDGTKSQMEAGEFSVIGSTMTFRIAQRPPVAVFSGPLPEGRVGTPYNFKIGAAGGLTPYTWTIIEGSMPAGISFGSDGTLSGVPEESTTALFKLAVAGDNKLSTTNDFSLTIKPVFSAPFVETFESGGERPDGWWEETVLGNLNWSFRSGSPEGHPANAYSNQYNAFLGVNILTQHVTRLVSPRIDFGPDARAAQLTFWHCMGQWINEQDELRVYFKTSVTEEWSLIATYLSPVEHWTQRTVTLPAVSRSCYVAFEGKAQYGYGVCLDEIRIFDPTPPLGITTESPLLSATTEVPYSLALSAEGGTPPYTFDVVAGALPDGFALSTNGVISGLSSNVQSSTFTVRLTDALGGIALKAFSLDVLLPRADLFAEGFETRGYLPDGWTQEFVTNAIAWDFRVGAPFGNPSAPYSGSYNACLFSSAWVDGGSFDQKTKLISPPINLGQAPRSIRLTFWQYMEEWEGGQDELRVFYRTSTNSAWALLPDAVYVTRVSPWTQRAVMLPNPSTTYQLAFEGNARFGYGVCLDEIRVTDATDAPLFTTASGLPDGVVDVAYGVALAVSGGLGPYTWSLVSGTLPAGLALDGASGVISGTPTASALRSFQVKVAGSDGKATTNLFSLRINSARTLPFVEPFENGGLIPAGWVQEYVLANQSWTFRPGSPVSPGGVPSGAHGGQYNACLYYDSGVVCGTKLISPMLNLGSGTNAQAQLTFWHCMANYLGDQDELRVMYKTSVTSSWQVLATYTQDVPGWTQRTLDLPSPSTTYFIAFEGWAKYGYGICIDDIGVTGNSSLSPYETWKVEVFGVDAGNELVSGDTADPDGDGIPNALEYAMGLDPMSPDTSGLPTGGVVAGYLTLSFRMDKGALDAGVLYEVEACTNLIEAAWTNALVSEQLPRADSNTWWQSVFQHDVPVTNAPRRFLRLKVTLP